MKSPVETIQMWKMGRGRDPLRARAAKAPQTPTACSVLVRLHVVLFNCEISGNLLEYLNGKKLGFDKYLECLEVKSLDLFFDCLSSKWAR